MSVLSEKSREIYANSNRRLAEKLGVPTLTPELLADSKKIINCIESLVKKDGKPLGVEAKKGHYNALMSLLPRDSLWLLYCQKVKAFNKTIQEESKKQELSEREEAKWLSWQEIVAVRDKLKPLTPNDFFAYQDWIILCLYTMIPPLRVDFSPMAVLEEMPGQVAGNFLVLSPQKNCFVFQDYKTSGRYGRQEFDIPNELLEILYEWVIYNPTGWLLLREDGEPYSEGNLSQRVGRVMERATRGIDGTPGKVCGITMFRHAYKTFIHAGEPTILGREEEARQMLHSPEMAQKYRRPNKE
jgi:hypothetical protein